MRDRRGEHARDACDAALGLEGVIGELKADVPMRAEWRAGLHRVLDAEARRPRERRWHVRPLTAVAAALAFTLVGAAAGTALVSRAMTPAIAASTAPAGEGTPARVASLTHDADVGVRFAVMAPGAARVTLVGDFNGWDPTATPLRRSRDGGTWSILLPLGAGRHTYAFLIDGEIVADPIAPAALEDDFGTPSSFVLVSSPAPPLSEKADP